MALMSKAGGQFCGVFAILAYTARLLERFTLKPSARYRRRLLPFVRETWQPWRQEASKHCIFDAIHRVAPACSL